MKRIILSLAGSALILTHAAHANPLEKGDNAFFLDNAFSGSPAYNLGRFVTDSTLLYGRIQLQDADNTDSTTVGLGARFYGNDFGGSDLRQFWNLSLSYGKADLDTPPAGSMTTEILMAGAHFGLEFSIAEPASISAQVGIEYSDIDANGTSSSNTVVGDASIQLNLYW